MELFRIRSLAEYETHKNRHAASIQAHQAFLDSWRQAKPVEFSVPGYSYTADRAVKFVVPEHFQFPNHVTVWRESLACPKTGFNNRMRATFHLFDIEMEPYVDQKIYITEQLTPIYRYFKERFANTVGSEFLADAVAPGATDSRGLRNEDLRALSFEDESFDCLISLDVFEHIPEYETAFKECYRVLAPGGRMMWSVPFIPVLHDNLIRARIVDGEIVHDHPPEYHGDPLSDEGVLCFQHFGWQMLDQMREAGFSDAYAIAYQSEAFGYLGQDQLMFFARK